MTTNITPDVAQRQADFIDELEEKLAELKTPPASQDDAGQEPTIRLNVQMPRSMHRQLKSIASMRGEKIVDVVTSMVAAYIAEHGGR